MRQVGSKLEPSSPKIVKTKCPLLLLSLLKLKVFKNSVLEGSGLDFKGPGPRFRKVLGRIFRDFGLLGKENAGTDFELAAKAARFQLGARVARSSHSNIELQPRFSRREGGRRWSPPGGLS